MVERPNMTGMQVLTSDGEFIGIVEETTVEGIFIRKSAGSERAAIPERWIATVDHQIHLDRTGAEANAGWRAMDFTALPEKKPADAARGAARPKPRSVVLMLIAAVVILILLALFL